MENREEMNLASISRKKIKHSKRPAKHTKKIIIYVLLTAWAIYVLFPIYWIFQMSLTTNTEVFQRPPRFFPSTITLDNYKAVLNLGGSVAQEGMPMLASDMPKYFTHSILLVSGSLLLTIVIGTLAAYALSRYKFRGKNVVSLLIVGLRVVPSLAILLPLYIIYRRWGLYNTYGGLILVYQLISLPFYVLLTRNHISTVPRELEEAAKIDGASLIQRIRYVIMPIILPGMVSASLLGFIYLWNNFSFALILGGNRTTPVTVGILNYIGYTQIDYTKMAAASILSMAPVIVIGILIQRYIVSGLTSGALKS